MILPDKEIDPNLPTYMKNAFTSLESRGAKHVQILLVGDIGSKKTYFIGTAPSPLVIDVDGGTRTIIDKDPEIFYIPYSYDRAENRKNGWSVYDTLMKLLFDAQYKQGPFSQGGRYSGIKTLALDGYTALSEKLVVEARISMGQDPLTQKPPLVKDQAYALWAEVLARLQSITRELKKIDMNIIATANTMLDKDEVTGRYFGFPDIQGSFREKIGRLFDEVYYMEVEGIKSGTSYTVSHSCYTVPTRYFKAKTRTNLPPIIEDITFSMVEDAWKKRFEVKENS